MHISYSYCVPFPDKYLLCKNKQLVASVYRNGHANGKQVWTDQYVEKTDFLIVVMFGSGGHAREEKVSNKKNTRNVCLMNAPC